MSSSESYCEILGKRKQQRRGDEVRNHRQRGRARVIMGVGFVVASVAAVLTVIFYVARHRVEEEWGSKFPRSPRAPAEVRSLLGSLVERPGNGPVPAFIPQSMWDNERCASGVIQAVNFTLGQNKLKVVAAWRFGTDNADVLRKVLDRSDNFATKKGKITETVAFNGDITEVLSSSRLYVAGFHFRQSRVDGQVIAAQADLNSHLVLLFEHQGEWWAYHFFHEGGREAAKDPFRVEKLSALSGLGFDLVYIWELSGFQMDDEEDSGTAVYTHYRPQLKEANGWLGLFGRGRFEYYTDTIASYAFGRGEQFPRVGDKNGVVVLVPPGVKAERGSVVGLYKGVEIHQNPPGKDESERSGYGLRWECVELINRFYTTALGHRNMQMSGHADSYYFYAEEKGLKSFPNGALEKPALNDIVMFDRDTREKNGSFGHVAVVTEVSGDHICVVQQNTSRWYQCLRLEKAGDEHWWVRETVAGLICVGWSRR